MARKPDTILDRLGDRRALARWSRAAAAAATADLASLRALRGRARQLRREIDRALAAAEARLSRPPGGEALPRPLHADWAWRPDLWRAPLTPPGLVAPDSGARLDGQAALFHDCRLREIFLRQLRNARPGDRAPFGLALEVFGFSGSFLSLALDLPDEAVRGLQKRHVIRAEVSAAAERPIRLFARLNIRYGPNTEQIVRELPPGPEAAAEFDLAYAALNERQVERAWLDLIFEAPAMNRVELRDVTLSRRPRAEA